MGGPGSSRWPRRYARWACIDDPPPAAGARWQAMRAAELADWELGGPRNLTPLRWSLHEKQSGRRLPLSTVTRNGGHLELCTRFGTLTVLATPQTIRGATGLRWWVLCPRCQSRRHALVIRGVDSAAACRGCFGLKYRSQRLDPIRRTAQRARRVGQRIDGSWRDGVDAEDPPPKPARMHWRRYERLVAAWSEAADEHEHEQNVELLRGIARFLPHLEAELAKIKHSTR